MRILEVGGLPLADARPIPEERGVTGDAADWERFNEQCSGNPLALKLTADTIVRLFNGNLGAFLKEPGVMVRGVCDVLDAQFARLTPLESSVMYWLAVERESVSAELLAGDMNPSAEIPKVVAALEALRTRSLIECGVEGFMLQNVVMEYVSERIITEMTAAILERGISYLDCYSLMKATAKEAVRASQERILLTPVAHRLERALGRENVLDHLKTLLPVLREQGAAKGYGAGNICNLALCMTGDVNGWDFSDLPVRQAWFVGKEAREADFTGTEFIDCDFTTHLGPVEYFDMNEDETQIAIHAYPSMWHYWSMPDFRYLDSVSGDDKPRAFDVDAGRKGFMFQRAEPEDGPLRYEIVDLETDRVIVTVDGCPAMDVSHKAGFIAAANETTFDIEIYDSKTGDLLRTLSGHTGHVQQRCMFFGPPEEKLLVTGSVDNTVRVWNVETGECLRVFEMEQPYQTLFNHDSTTVIMTTWTPTPRTELRDMKTGKLRGRFEGSLWANFSKGERHMVGVDAEGTVWLWDVDEQRVIRKMPGHGTFGQFRAMFVHDDQYLVTGDSSPAVRFWDVKNGTCVKKVEGLYPTLLSTAISPDCETLAISDASAGIRLYDLASGDLVRTLRGKTTRVWGMDFSPDGALLAGGSNRSSGATIWNASTGEVIHHLPAGPEVVDVRFSPDGGMILCTSDNHAADSRPSIWDVNTGELLTHVDNYLLYGAFSPDGSVLAAVVNLDEATGPFVVELRDVISGKCIMTLTAGESNYTYKGRNTLFTSDGKYLASERTLGDYRWTHVWDLTTGDLVSTVENTRLLGFEDETTFLTRSSGTIRRWKIGQEEPVDTWETAIDGASQACNVQHGILTTILRTKQSRNVYVWDLATGEQLAAHSPLGPYDRMNITGARGLSEGRQAGLRALGALNPNK